MTLPTVPAGLLPEEAFANDATVLVEIDGNVARVTRADFERAMMNPDAASGAVAGGVLLFRSPKDKLRALEYTGAREKIVTGSAFRATTSGSVRATLTGSIISGFGRFQIVKNDTAVLAAPGAIDIPYVAGDRIHMALFAGRIQNGVFEPGEVQGFVTYSTTSVRLNGSG